MKATLKPEEERIVTPGPIAVEDLEALEVTIRRGKFIQLELDSCYDHEDKPLQEWARSSVAMDWMSTNIPRRMDLRTALEHSDARTGYLPSMPMTMRIMQALYGNMHPNTDQPEPWYTLERMFTQYIRPGTSILTNSVYYAFGGQVWHYPHFLTEGTTRQDGFNEGLPFESRNIRIDESGEFPLKEIWTANPWGKRFLDNMLGKDVAGSFIKIAQRLGKQIVLSHTNTLGHTPLEKGLYSILWRTTNDKLIIDTTQYLGAEGLVRLVKT